MRDHIFVTFIAHKLRTFLTVRVTLRHDKGGEGIERGTGAAGLHIRCIGAECLAQGNLRGQRSLHIMIVESGEIWADVHLSTVGQCGSVVCRSGVMSGRRYHAFLVHIETIDPSVAATVLVVSAKPSRFDVTEPAVRP